LAALLLRGDVYVRRAIVTEFDAVADQIQQQLHQLRLVTLTVGSASYVTRAPRSSMTAFRLLPRGRGPLACWWAETAGSGCRRANSSTGR